MFDDCTVAEIKVVNAPCCWLLIIPEHPDLEETEVTQLIRRDNLLLTRQLSHASPINLHLGILGMIGRKHKNWQHSECLLPTHEILLTWDKAAVKELYFWLLPYF